jgi:cbb3-type cytochrome oxidase cytochrome c subunit/cytochrome c553
MTPAVIVIGSMILFWVAFLGVVVIPTVTIPDEGSEIWRPNVAAEDRGRKLYIANGCVYCHSQYVRPQDWTEGAQRIAQAGDYAKQQPPLLGSQRTGPDLSQEGGERPDDWHLAHFLNPRHTSPASIMPDFSFHSRAELADLTSYLQSLGGRQADYRVARQGRWKRAAVEAYRAGPDANIAWIHAQVPEVWRRMPNPYPATGASLARGQRVYELYCVGCHGPTGDGRGTAEPYLNPPPLNFALMRRHLEDGKYVGGLLYYQIMNGITGTAMPYFKTQLESAKIWDVSNYIAHDFIGWVDYQFRTDQIDPAYENAEPEPPKPYVEDQP